MVKSNNEEYTLGTSLKTRLIGTLLAIITVATLMLPVMAQGALTGSFTVQINFYYPNISALTNVRVVLSDQTGRVVATAVSTDGSMVLLVFASHTPEYWLAASATGFASFSYFDKPWPLYGVAIITVQNFGGNPGYSQNGYYYGGGVGYYYATIILRRAA